MGEFGIIVLFLLAYPFMAAWMVGAGRSRRLEALEREVAALRAALQEAGMPPPADDTGLAGSRSVQPASPAPAPAPPESASPVPAYAYRAIQVRPAGRPAWSAMPATAVEPRVSVPAVSTVEAPIHHPAPEPGAAVAPDVPSNGNQQAGIPSSPSTPPRWFQAAKDWLLAGNPVAKLGLVILFIGVGFLLKYVAGTVVVPIELRLAGVVLADLALLGWGWRLRTARREIGLPVQGTAIAILMLVVFGAYQRYGLLPAGFAFTLLVVLTAFTCLLALLQDAFWLAVFGITGGFAAPLLVATGQGNHIALFSYYALMNAGVFAFALKRSWRTLNLLGFAFTFVVGAAWGGLRYTPDHYLSAQGFLVLFFLLYVAIALAWARRQQTRLKDYVDAALVLGTPLLAFGLQAGLVREREFGLAWSALAFGGVYLALALVLLRRGQARWRVLVETFMAIGVIFGTLAIPFALDGRWTSGAWALEGAGFVWFGLRRGERRTWIFGLLLQAGAWLGFIRAATGLDAAAALASNLWLGFVLLAGSAFAIAADLRRHGAGAPPQMNVLANWGLAIAAAWLLAGWWTEALMRSGGSALANWLVGGAMLTSALLAFVAVRMAWRVAAVLALGVQLLGAAGLAAVSGDGWSWLDRMEATGDKPLLGAVMIALAALASSRMIGRAVPGPAGKWLAPLLLGWGGIGWFGPVINIAAGRFLPWMPDALGDADACWIAAYALAVALSVFACMRLARRLDWAALRWLGSASWAMLFLVTPVALVVLYGERKLLDPAVWLAWAILLASGEHVLRVWAAHAQTPRRAVLQVLHGVRTAGPWLALWPAGSLLVKRWLSGAGLAAEGWTGGAIDAAWSNYLPAWAMLLALGLLLRRSRTDGWPTRPLADWYRTTVVPAGALPMLALATAWNLGQDGSMAPLPYLPLLNPLDITTGFVLLLWTGAMPALSWPGFQARWHGHLRSATMVLAYAWFNLILLRTAAHVLGIAYRLDVLAASQFVQAMLSLVWSASALVLMRYAAQRTMRRTWGTGALLLGIVVLKLFVVDLANGGSMARIVSFVGAGLLMVLIGYFAPYPKAGEGTRPQGAGT